MARRATARRGSRHGEGEGRVEVAAQQPGGGDHQRSRLAPEVPAHEQQPPPGPFPFGEGTGGVAHGRDARMHDMHLPGGQPGHLHERPGEPGAHRQHSRRARVDVELALAPAAHHAGRDVGQHGVPVVRVVHAEQRVVAQVLVEEERRRQRRDVLDLQDRLAVRATQRAQQRPAAVLVGDPRVLPRRGHPAVAGPYMGGAQGGADRVRNLHTEINQVGPFPQGRAQVPRSVRPGPAWILVPQAGEANAGIRRHTRLHTGR